MIENCHCLKQRSMYDSKSIVCKNCPWYLVIGSLNNVKFKIKRQDFMKRLIDAGHTTNDRLVVLAICKQYNINYKAAELSFRRARRKWKIYHDRG